MSRQACTTCPKGTHGQYDFPKARTFDLVTLGHGGWSGYFSCVPNGSSSHYGHTFIDRIDASTIVVDLTVMDTKDLVRFAVQGPMVDPSLPDGEVSRCPGADPLLIEHIAERIGLSLSGLDRVGITDYARLAVENGASVSLGDDFVCDREPWNVGDTVCADCTRHRKSLAAAA